MSCDMLLLLVLLPVFECATGGGSSFDFDLLVIGGGSGGIACAKEAARLGAHVGLCDYVEPSPHGTVWGLGGTCVNVGCIPKKLMHRAGQLRALIEREAPAFGWRRVTDDTSVDLSSDSSSKGSSGCKGEGSEAGVANAAESGDVGIRVQHAWTSLVSRVQAHVRSLNFGYRSALQKAGVRYLNAFASFQGQDKVALRDRKGRVRVVRANRVVLAVGGRPKFPDSFRGAVDHCISSDDLFSLHSHPGKTLVVGGSYVALECAGFLTSLGCDVTLLMRSIPLRGFDRECSERVLASIEEEGARIKQFCLPVLATTSEQSGRVRVRWRALEVTPDIRAGSARAEEEDGEDEFDTVLVAAGRVPETGALNLDAAGVKMRSDGKVATHDEATSAAHVFCIGDAAAEAQGRPELTPVAIRAGVLLARRLFGGSAERFVCSHVPTAVFTPLEYACVGMSEEEAQELLGDNLEVYHTNFAPLESLASGGSPNRCFCKVLCDRSRDERIVGLHYCGDHAGEVVQGFAVAMRVGIRKADLDETIGIHPTAAEELVGLQVTKQSQMPAEKEGC
uniref:Glutathione-disulfide reductase n=1 Tax=Coccolithus braarudii TaxID=221442 RepID=A0A7S0LF39_9EUKA|mmetsp:Transcript_33953/g.72510  ORF Transcript_33953/g.72510 Transcript_33953/m.72510 type:complete len:563 (+) Transcript_33953:73-1761(+)